MKVRYIGLFVALLLAPASANAAIIISEIFYNLNGSEGTATEWIEITNTGNATVDLTNWTYEDIQDVVATNPFPAGTQIGPGESAVIVEQAAATFQSIWGAGVNVINASPGISLGNTGSATNETVAIRNNLGVIVDEVNYETDTNGWPAAAAANGESIYLLPGAFSLLANDLGANWAGSVAGVNGAYTALILNPGIANATVPDVASPGTAIVPEPTTVVLMAVGLCMTLLKSRRRNEQYPIE